MRSICDKCSNEPCRNLRPITPGSHYFISDQFKLEFDFSDGRLIIVKCSGFNKKDYYYIPAKKDSHQFKACGKELDMGDKDE